MERKYQVFISSTYIDLIEERNQVSRAILDTGCIPAGMEQFPAFDEEQFNYIKRIIDYCDYYVIILGGRYGSMDSLGVSYTEKEFDYAIEKGINVLAFINSNPSELSIHNKESDPSIIEKLDNFRKKVSKGRMCKMWNKSSELHGQVAISLMKTIQERPAIGWVRANKAADTNILLELNEQRKINEQLREENNTLYQYKQYINATEMDSLAGLENEVLIHGTFKYSENSYPGTRSRWITREWEINLTWEKLFALVSPYLMNKPNDQTAKSHIASALYKETNKTSKHSHEINDQDFQTIKIHLKALGLVNIERLPTTSGGQALFWSLTDMGSKLMVELRSVKK